MSEHWDTLIERILAQEIDMHHDEVRAACKDPEFLDRLDGSLAVLSELEQAEVLDEARSEAIDPIEDRLADLVRRELSSAKELPPAPSRSRSWLMPVLAAAAALALLFTLNFDGEPQEVEIPPIPLGEKGFRCLTPMGPNADFSAFTWENDLSGSVVEIAVFDLEGELLDGGESGPLHDSNSWSPAPADLEGWPQQIEWSLSRRLPGQAQPELVYGEASR